MHINSIYEHKRGQADCGAHGHRNILPTAANRRTTPRGKQPRRRCVDRCSSSGRSIPAKARRYAEQRAGERAALHAAGMQLAFWTNVRGQSASHRRGDSAPKTDTKPYNHAQRWRGLRQSIADRTRIPRATASTKTPAAMWRRGGIGWKSANCTHTRHGPCSARTLKFATTHLGGYHSLELLTRTAAPAARCRLQ